MKKIFIISIIAFMISSCNSLQYYENVSIKDSPNYKLKNIKFANKKDFVGLQRILYIDGVIELDETGWELIGYTVQVNKIENNKREKDIYIQVKNEYWNKRINDNSNEKNNQAMEYINDNENFETFINDQTFSAYNIIPLFQKFKTNIKTYEFHIEDRIGIPWGHNYYKITMKDFNKNIYWYEIK